MRKKLILDSEWETELDVIYSGIHDGPFSLDYDEIEKTDFYSPKQIKKLINKLTPFSLKVLKELNII